jgi:hypothetical protein
MSRNSEIIPEFLNFTFNKVDYTEEDVSVWFGEFPLELSSL